MSAAELSFRHQIGRELRNERQRQGLTLGQMAYKSGVSRGYITEIEFGVKEPSSRTLAKMFAALKVTPEVSLHPRNIPGMDPIGPRDWSDCVICEGS